MFGEHIRRLRQEKRIGLREFCRRTNIDPSYWSKVERGLVTPAYDGALEVNLANALGLNYQEMKRVYFYAKFCKLLGLARTKEDLKLMLPVFVHTVNGKKPTKKQLMELASVLLSETTN